MNKSNKSNTKRIKNDNNELSCYKAQGLVEALLALFLASVAGVVFLSLAQDTYMNMDRIEVTERLVREMEGVSAKVTRLADLENSKELDEPSYFPFNEKNDWKMCYRIQGNISSPSFSLPICDYASLKNRENECRTRAVVDGLEEGDFASFCINSYDGDSGIVTGVIYSGRIDCRKVAFTGSCLISDQEKNVVLKLN